MTDRRIPAELELDLRAAAAGLGEADVALRRNRFGYNDILTPAPHGWLHIARDTARDPMVWFLIAVAILFLAIGNRTEALILAIALAPLIGMDAFLHRRTQASTRGLATRLAARAVAIRDGKRLELPARDLVPGDLVELGTGDFVPADGVIVGAEGLQIDESSLTGEAAPVRKSPFAGNAAESLVAGRHWALAGTRLLAGRGCVRLVFTGPQTLYGGIARTAVAGGEQKTPLQSAILDLVGRLLIAALALCVLLAAIRLVQGYGWVDALLSALTLAIAALPEEFPVVFSVFLGVGVYRLARRQALVRRAVAVEAIGRTTCICTDKTGTMTEGRLALDRLLPAGGQTERSLLRWAARAARPESGDPVDRLLIGAAGLDEAIERLAVHPFTEQRRRETAIVRLPNGETWAIAKGAPETIFALCSDAPAQIERWTQLAEADAHLGHKVIACAARQLAAGEHKAVEPSGGYAIFGLVTFEDPLRDGVHSAIAECRAAGIRVVMVTGDHRATAGAIARAAGLGGALPSIAEADALGSHGTIDAAMLTGIDVVARATPAQKLELVRALQRDGHIVAVTGDGVNDVPALKSADIGIAIGGRGTQSAREVAAIVLLDDSFRTIVRAIAEGRQLFRNLQLAFAYLLMIHIPLVLTAAIVPLSGQPLLYLPIHIVWLELVIHPTAMLVFQELPGTERLEHRPTSAGARFFDRAAWAAIVFGGLALTAAVLGAYWFGARGTGDTDAARSLALGTLLAGSAGITAGLSRLETPASWLVPAISTAALGAALQVPDFAHALHLQSLSGAGWAILAVVAAVAYAAAAWTRRSMSFHGVPAGI